MTAPDRPLLVGGVGQLYQGDLDLGRRAAERLSSEPLGPGVVVEDLFFGAVAVAQLLEDVAPSCLVLVGAEQRGRAPGTVERCRLRAEAAAGAQSAVAEAVQGYVGMQLLVDACAALGALPERVVTVEVEPASIEPSTELTPEAAAGLEEALALVRAEADRAPLLGLAGDIRAQLAEASLEPSPALEALEGLLAELRVLDERGRWGRAFAYRDALRSAIAAGETSEGMTHLDWGLWWTLIEALDHRQRAEAPAK